MLKRRIMGPSWVSVSRAKRVEASQQASPAPALLAADRFSDPSPLKESKLGRAGELVQAGGGRV